MTITPAQLAAMDQEYAEAEQLLNENIATARGIVDGQSSPHAAIGALSIWLEAADDESRSAALTLLMHRVVKLTAQLERVTALETSRIGAGEAIGRLGAGDGVDVAFYAGVSFALAKVHRAIDAAGEVSADPT